MSTTYLKDALNPRQTHQSKPIPGREADMEANAAGGYAFKVDNWDRLRRFLVIGTAGGTFYIQEDDLTRQNAEVVVACLKEDGARTVKEIVEISEAGRAPKNDFAIYALALACTPAYADDATRQLAFDAVRRVCRTGTHILMFSDVVNSMRSWGRGLKRAVAAWYENPPGNEKIDPAQRAAYQAVKYQKREGWRQRDVLRSAHPKVAYIGAREVYDWICGRPTEDGVPLPPSIRAYERVQSATTTRAVVAAIEEFGGALPHEIIPTNLKADGEVWLALLRAGMPLTAMIRNLANMTRYGTITPNSEGERIVRETLANRDALHGSRVHPFAVLTALKRYGQGGKPRERWGYGYYSYERADTDKTFTPNQRIMDALDKAFYDSFANVDPSGKRFVLGIDVSGSMSQLAGTPPKYDARTGRQERENRILRCSEVAAAFGMVIENSEPWCATMGFDSGMIDLGISHRERIDQVADRICGINGGGTDCSLPMLWALENNVAADCFLVITDNETWAGRMHPAQALAQYRRETGINAKLVVAALVASGHSIADPNDLGMLDVVGFDSSLPTLVSDFAAGRA